MSTADQDNTFEQLLQMSDSDLNAQMMDSSAPEGEASTANDEVVVAAPTQPEPKGDTAQAESSAAPAAAKVEEEAQPQGVLAKDEKHILPFKVVEDLRSSKAELERVVREQNQQIEALKATKAAGAENADVLADTEFLTDEQLNELEQEMPALAKTLRGTQTALKQVLTDRATEKQEREHEEQQRLIKTRDEVRSTVQAAIDQTPKLSHLQATDPIAFQRAKEIDIERSKNPATAAHWNALPLADRFAQVMTDYEAKFGEVKVASLPEKPATPAGETKPTPKPAGPISLSDLPGGASPATDARAEITAKHGSEIIADMSKWTPAQMESFFANI